MRDAPLFKRDETRPEPAAPPPGRRVTVRDERIVRLVRLQMYERSLAVPAPRVTLPDGVELVVVDRFLATGEVKDDWHPAAAGRLRDGETCVLARHGSDVVAYCWLATSPVWVGEIGRAVVPAPDEVYFYDAFTAPAWRGRGLFSATLSHLVALAQRRGCTRGLIFVESGNVASRRVIEKTGFQLVHTAICVELGRLRPWWIGGRRPPSSRVTLVKEDRRVIEERP